MQLPLPGIERNTDRMIEMRVRDKNVRRADELIGTASDIEAGVELANAKPGLMPGARYAFDVEVRGVYVYDIHLRAKSRRFSRVDAEARRKPCLFSAPPRLRVKPY